MYLQCVLRVSMSRAFHSGTKPTGYKAIFNDICMIQKKPSKASKNITKPKPQQLNAVVLPWISKKQDRPWYRMHVIYPAKKKKKRKRKKRSNNLTYAQKKGTPKQNNESLGKRRREKRFQESGERAKKKGMMEKIILEFTSNDAIPSNAFYQGHTRDWSNGPPWSDCHVPSTQSTKPSRGDC